MDNSNAAAPLVLQGDHPAGISSAPAPLVLPGDHPADIMTKVASVAAFLESTVNGDHIKPDAPMTLYPDAMNGLALVLGAIRAAAEQASDMV